MDCIIQIFTADNILANGCIDSGHLFTWYYVFFLDIRTLGYLILILTLNLMSVYWIYFWGERLDRKPKFKSDPLLGIYMVTSFLGSLIFLFIIYEWYSAVFFIILFMLVTNGIGRVLDSKYSKEENKLYQKLDELIVEIPPLMGEKSMPEEEARRLLPHHEKWKEGKKKIDEKLSKLTLTRSLRNIKIYTSISILCNFYAAYQIFQYYQ